MVYFSLKGLNDPKLSFSYYNCCPQANKIYTKAIVRAVDIVFLSQLGCII